MWWLAHGEHEVPPSLGWLTPSERDHLASIRFTKRRNEYLTRRWTAKQAIASVLDLDRTPASLARIEVRHRPSGAPYVHLDGRAAEVDVSLSDRAGWAVCLVGPPGSAESGTLGIDLEVVEPRSEGFVTDFFTSAELEHVRGLTDLDALARGGEPHLVGEGGGPQGPAGRAARRHEDGRGPTRQRSQAGRVGPDERDRSGWSDARVVATRRRLRADHRLQCPP